MLQLQLLRQYQVELLCAHAADISYQYTELRPAEGKEGEDESTLELTLGYDDLDPPPAKKLASEEEIAKER